MKTWVFKWRLGFIQKLELRLLFIKKRSVGSNFDIHPSLHLRRETKNRILSSNFDTHSSLHLRSEASIVATNLWWCVRTCMSGWSAKLRGGGRGDEPSALEERRKERKWLGHREGERNGADPFSPARITYQARVVYNNQYVLLTWRLDFSKGDSWV